jgi:hypothetical protein
MNKPETNCTTCAYKTEHRQPHEIKPTMACNRFPPTSHLVPQPGGVGIMAVFPPVNETYCCGEYQPAIINSVNLLN